MFFLRSQHFRGLAETLTRMFRPPSEFKKQLIALSSQESTKSELTTTPLRKQDIPQTGLPHLMVTRSVSPFTIWGTIDELDSSKYFEQADSMTSENCHAYPMSLLANVERTRSIGCDFSLREKKPNIGCTSLTRLSRVERRTSLDESQLTFSSCRGRVSSRLTISSINTPANSCL